MGGNTIDDIFPVSNTYDTRRKEPVKTLGKDDFLQLFITQLVHQNPMEPMDNDQFINQMTQFTALEQATNTASSVAKLLEAQVENNELLSMLLYHQVGSVSKLMYESSSLIGRRVVVAIGEEPPVSGTVVGIAMNSGEVEVRLSNGLTCSLTDIVEIFQ